MRRGERGPERGDEVHGMAERDERVPALVAREDQRQRLHRVHDVVGGGARVTVRDALARAPARLHGSRADARGSPPGVAPSPETHSRSARAVSAMPRKSPFSTAASCALAAAAAGCSPRPAGPAYVLSICERSTPCSSNSFTASSTASSGSISKSSMLPWTHSSKVSCVMRLVIFTAMSVRAAPRPRASDEVRDPKRPNDEVPISKPASVLTGFRFDAWIGPLGISEVAETNRLSALPLAPPQSWTNWVCFELLDRRALYYSVRI